jgi:hypothetical protein
MDGAFATRLCNSPVRRFAKAGGTIRFITTNSTVNQQIQQWI